MTTIPQAVSRIMRDARKCRVFIVAFSFVALCVAVGVARLITLPSAALSSSSTDRGEVSELQVNVLLDERAGVNVDNGVADASDDLGEVLTADEAESEGDSVATGDADASVSDEPLEVKEGGDETAKDIKGATKDAEPADGQEVSASAEAGDATVSLEAAAGANLPADAELRVEEVDPQSKEYEAYKKQALKALGTDGTVALARFFDITIVSGGEEVQPDEGVQVSIEVPDAPAADEGAEASVVHFQGAAKKGADVVDATEDAGTTTFEAESFSVYGVVYTVDFEYDVDGQTYELSLPG